MKATPIKNIQTTVQAIAYGYYKADATITPNDKISDIELRRYAERLGTTGDAPEVAMKAVLDYAQTNLGKSQSANVARADMNKTLGLVMRDIARAAGSSAGKGFKDGDVLSTEEYATLSNVAKAVVDAARKYPGRDGQWLFDINY